MKQLLLIILLIITGLGASAQKDTAVAVKKKKLSWIGGDGIYLRDSLWKVGGYAGVTLSQTALYQWGPGGTNNFSFLIASNAYANYKSGKALWENNLDIKWGMVANGLVRTAALAGRNFQKNIDVLAFKSNVGYELKKELYASIKLGFESQFTPSYDYSQTDTSGGRLRKYTVSKFFAPAVITIGPGLTYKPKPYITVFFTPIEGKLTFVTKDDPGRSADTLSDGTHADRYFSDVDETRFGLKKGYGFMGELGAELDVAFQKDIVKNVNWKSHLNIFASYMNANYNTLVPYYYSGNDSLGFRNILPSTKSIPVVKWDNDFVFKINKFLSATLSTRFVYQYNATVPIDKRNNSTGAKGADGVTDVDKNGKPILAFNKLQIFEQFGIGLALKF